MKQKPSNMDKPHSDQISQSKDINITKVFDTTPERLFRAWTDEKDFALWFGPEGFEITFCRLDVSVGGNWKTCIVDKNGDEYWMEGKYMEIIKNEKLVFTFNNDGGGQMQPDEETRVTVTFSKDGDQTIMKFNQAAFKTLELQNGHDKGWRSAFVCLLSHINKMKS